MIRGHIAKLSVTVTTKLWLPAYDPGPASVKGSCTYSAVYSLLKCNSDATYTLSTLIPIPIILLTHFREIISLCFYLSFQAQTLIQHSYLSIYWISFWIPQTTGHLHAGTISSMLFSERLSSIYTKKLSSCHEAFPLFLHPV